MKKGYIIRNQEKIHFITATVVDWIDVFTRKSYKDIVIDCFALCFDNKGMLLYGIVDNPVIDVLKKSSITKYSQY